MGLFWEGNDAFFVSLERVICDKFRCNLMFGDLSMNILLQFIRQRVFGTESRFAFC